MIKVLLVEDSDVMRSLIAAALDTIAGCEVVEVCNGLEALRRLPQERFNLVITDINMPDLNGLELLSFIRGHAEMRTLPVLIVTTESSAQDRDRGMALGANAYITKPFGMDDLSATVKRILALPA